MLELLASGRLVDLILLVVGLEVALLLVVRRATGRGLKPLDLLGQLLAGFFLLCALRCALAGTDVRWIAGFLTASLPAHLFDLRRRWRTAPGADLR